MHSSKYVCAADNNEVRMTSMWPFRYFGESAYMEATLGK